MARGRARAGALHAARFQITDELILATALDRAIERLQKSVFDIDRLAALINSDKSRQRFPDRLLVKSGSRLVPIRMIDIV